MDTIAERVERLEERMLSLDDIAEKLPEKPLGETEVDISAHMGEEPGTSVLRFREPSTAEMFQIPEDAQIARQRYPDWNEALANSVAMLALSHVSPGSSKPIAEFYCRLADRNRDVFLFVMSRFKNAFPHLADFQGAVAAEKNDSGAQRESSFTSASTT